MMMLRSPLASCSHVFPVLRQVKNRIMRSYALWWKRINGSMTDESSYNNCIVAALHHTAWLCDLKEALFLLFGFKTHSYNSSIWSVLIFLRITSQACLNPNQISPTKSKWQIGQRRLFNQEFIKRRMRSLGDRVSKGCQSLNWGSNDVILVLIAENLGSIIEVRIAKARVGGSSVVDLLLSWRGARDVQW